MAQVCGNKESGTFELASGTGQFLGDVHCCPLHTPLRKEIMTSNFDICIGHGTLFKFGECLSRFD